ncbi:MAG: tRNA (adenosine(37)-N6)-dimethylallyltransferase MiaA [Gammaproteobacteria bacterium]|nr:tRNA (adenosine(37)-N6)-dimethylallyltransferase MiaA [Gammaproteobacteria bacterium]
MLNKSLICLMGPTASGKTQLAVELVQKFPCEIISVDSAMVYRGMNIGTAKPDAETLKIAPHKLLDIRDPADAYSAADFCKDALSAIEDITSRNKIPLLVGGTMMYFNALQKGLSDLPSADADVREKINLQAYKFGWEAMHAQLQKIDPVAAARIHANDTQRIQRALEVFEMTGTPLTELQKQKNPLLSDYHIINLAIAPTDRKILHERIAQRFIAMLDQGFIEEVKLLFAREDLNLDTPAIRSVGYRQVWEYLLGQLTYEEMIEKGIIATRQLAKRQLTWLRHWTQLLQWFDSEENELVFDFVAESLKQCRLG